jgi:hypothetical protein
MPFPVYRRARKKLVMPCFLPVEQIREAYTRSFRQRMLDVEFFDRCYHVGTACKIAPSSFRTTSLHLVNVFNFNPSRKLLSALSSVVTTRLSTIALRSFFDQIPICKIIFTCMEKSASDSWTLYLNPHAEALASYSECYRVL